MWVPQANGNREYEIIKEWLAEGNVPEPEFTEAELAQQAKEQARQEALTTIAQLEASQLRSIRELMLDANNEYAKAKLAEIEAKIQAERVKLWCSSLTAYEAQKGFGARL